MVILNINLRNLPSLKYLQMKRRLDLNLQIAATNFKSSAQQAFDNTVECEDIIKLAYATFNEQYETEDSCEEQYEHDAVVVLKQAIMTATIDKTNSESSSNHYYEATIHKLIRSRITSVNEFILM